MKKLSIVLAILPFLAAGPALSQDRHPETNPDWTWMSHYQAVQIFQGKGYGHVSLEKRGASWRGEATRDTESYQVDVNRYGEVSHHRAP